MHLAIMCGGPSKERGISLNSARSLMDHCQDFDLTILYVDCQKRFYHLKERQLYSNTPSDFDFKLEDPLSESALTTILETVDCVFPAIHGAFGEDGALQDFLETLKIPFVGSSSTACRKMFYKHQASLVLKENGFSFCPSVLIDGDTSLDTVVSFFKDNSQGVIKPSAGGSSIGVSLVTTPREALEKAHDLGDYPVLLEPFLTGKEFTVLVIENSLKQPVSLIPTEICIEAGEIFDYRRKYLPTSNTKWLCPGNFSDEVIEKIRKKAEDLFIIFGAKDFARFDGWILEGGEILFTDFNPISGMEQNSFLFQQASRIGMTHRDILHYIVTKHVPKSAPKSEQRLPVLFGGVSAERQVSVMSGTNVWLKLRQHFDAFPCFLDPENNVWELPYTYALNHTTEEIYENCLHAKTLSKRLEKWVPLICERLGIATHIPLVPTKKKLDDFLKNYHFIFNALHGGAGEDGTLQNLMDQKEVIYNGSGVEASKVCMDKFETSKRILALNDPYLTASHQLCISRFQLQNNAPSFEEWVSALEAHVLLIKPQSDGCSTGVFRLRSQDDLDFYIRHLDDSRVVTDDQSANLSDTQDFVVEPFVQTDLIYSQGHDLCFEEKTGWIELTVGVLEKDGCYRAMPPSITVSSGAFLTLEEKFQGGTGINITPPPFISEGGMTRLKESVEKSAKVLGIRQYARLDVFFHLKSHRTHLIEANTLPALTPSTVIYHQALEMGMRPDEFLKGLCININPDFSKLKNLS